MKNLEQISLQQARQFIKRSTCEINGIKKIYYLWTLSHPSLYWHGDIVAGDPRRIINELAPDYAKYYSESMLSTIDSERDSNDIETRRLSAFWVTYYSQTEKNKKRAGERVI